MYQSMSVCQSGWQSCLFKDTEEDDEVPEGGSRENLKEAHCLAQPRIGHLSPAK